MDAKYNLWIFLSWTSFLGEEKLPQCVVGFELNQDVVFLKICPFLRSSEIGAAGDDASVIVDVPLFILEQFDRGLCFGEQTNWAFADFCLCLCSNLDERQSFFEGTSRSPVVCC